MKCFVYALKSDVDGSLYIGMSSDVSKRLKQHNSGMTSSNRHRTPFKLFYSKEFETTVEARKYEKYLKSGIGREFLKNLRDQKSH